MLYMAQTSVIQPVYVAILQTERETHSWPLESMGVFSSPWCIDVAMSS